MRARFLTTGLVLLLFASGWTSVLAASFCPHMGSDHACCPAMNQRARLSSGSAESSAESMHSMEGMSGMERTSAMEMEPVSQKSTDADALTKTEEPCSHCLMHSQLPVTEIALRNANEAHRPVVLAAPPVASLVGGRRVPFLCAGLTRQHAPPGSTTGLHVLISSFRI